MSAEDTIARAEELRRQFNEEVEELRSRVPRELSENGLRVTLKEKFHVLGLRLEGLRQQYQTDLRDQAHREREAEERGARRGDVRTIAQRQRVGIRDRVRSEMIFNPLAPPVEIRKDKN